MATRFYEVPLTPIEDTLTVIIELDDSLEEQALSDAIESYVEENYPDWVPELIDVQEVDEEGNVL